MGPYAIPLKKRPINVNVFDCGFIPKNFDGPMYKAPRPIEKNAPANWMYGGMLDRKIGVRIQPNKYVKLAKEKYKPICASDVLNSFFKCSDSKAL